MTTTFTTRPLNHNGAQSVAVDFLPAHNRRPIEIDEATKQLALERAIRKATAQLRRSVKLSNPLEAGIYSPLSGRRVAAPIERLVGGRISRCHQHS